MTEAQWLLEYYAIREKEKEQADQITNSIKIFKYLMIKLLGLDIFAKLDEISSDKKEESGIDGIKFVPLSLIAGRRDIVETAMQKLADAEKVQTVMQDDEFEKLSAAIASGDIGDMDPIISPVFVDPVKQWNTEDNVKQLQSLGVKITDNLNTNNVHIKFDKEGLQERKLASAMERATAQKELEEQLKQEQDQFKSKRLTFFSDEEQK